jgi:hypothetical protein
MTLSIGTRKVIALFFATVFSLSVSAQTPAPNTTEWESETLKLRLFYPSDLVKADTEQVMRDGRLTLFGISGASDFKLAEATHCLRPVLLLELPQSPSKSNATVEPGFGGGTRVTTTPSTSATILLAELDINCLTPEQQNKATNLLSEMAEIVNKVPGMKSIASPATYTIGWQKVHMAAAQGQPQAQPSSADPQLSGQPSLYTMGLSTNWNSHLLVWYFSSNNIDMLNRITKTTVRFGRDQAAPLYPLTIGNATP